MFIKAPLLRRPLPAKSIYTNCLEHLIGRPLIVQSIFSVLWGPH